MKERLKAVGLGFALLFLGVCNGVAANNIYSVRLTFTNQPVDGNSFTVNGSTRTFKTVVASPEVQIAIGASTVDTVANTLSHINEHPFAGMTPAPQENATNIVLLADTINFAITASKSGSWGTAVAKANSIQTYTVTMPLEYVTPLSHRTNLANWFVLGMRDFATTNFPAGESVLVHYLDDATGKTIAGSNTFTGANIFSHSAQQWIGGLISNATVHATTATVGDLNVTGFVNWTNAAPALLLRESDASADNRVAVLEQNGGIISLVLYDDALATSNRVFTIARSGASVGNITLNGTVLPLKLVSADIEGILTNVSLFAVTNAVITNLFAQGIIKQTNANPGFWLYDSDGAADEKRLVVSGAGGALTVMLENDAQSSFVTPFRIARSGAAAALVYLGGPSATHVEVEGPFWNNGNTLVTGDVGVSGVIGAGMTNPIAPAGMSSGVLLTNAITEPSADPASAAALWGFGGELKARAVGDGVNWRVKNAAAISVGSGSDYNLTGSYAQVTFGSSVTLSLPTAGTYRVLGLVTIDEDAGNANDSISVKLYNSTDAADITGSERTISSLPAGKRGAVVLESIVTVTGAKTIQLHGKNTSAPRGSIDSEQTSLSYIRLF